VALVNDLPPDWDSYGAAQKIAWFNANGVSVDELQSAGVDSATMLTRLTSEVVLSS